MDILGCALLTEFYASLKPAELMLQKNKTSMRRHSESWGIAGLV